MPDPNALSAIDVPLHALALKDRVARSIAVTDRPAARLGLDRLTSRAREADVTDLSALLADPIVKRFLEGVFSGSIYLGDLMVNDPARLARILKSDPADSVASVIAGLAVDSDADEPAVMRHLRLAKQEVALAVGLADLAKAWETMRVTDALARFADAALQIAIDFALRSLADRGKIRLPDPAHPSFGTGYIVLAMGKHGAYELNYSSDIDLIVFFDAGRARPLLADPDEVTDFFVRVTKQVVRLMQTVTPDGYVFRVDLRLRPDPGATPIAMSTDAAMQYYGSIGQNWERAALIKARAAAGDIEAGKSFLAELRPFIWRKFFDYAAIADVHSIKRQIHAVKGHGEIAVAGHDVKLGRGGIREIEFFVQTQQLIAGGRNPDLRGRQTLANLDALVTFGWIEPRVRDEMREAYLFLRDVEHRIQMVADQQTHKLPATEAGVARIAAMMGFRKAADFAKALVRQLETVQRHYLQLFENAPELSSGSGSLVFTGAQDDPETLETLASMGYAHAADVAAAIRAWHFGRYNATRSTVARERLTELTPALLRALAATGNADETFRAFDRFVAGLPAGVQIFSLLASNPGLLLLLAEIMGGAAPRLAETLTRRPRVIDALLDPAFFGKMPTEAELGRRLELTFRDAVSYEDCLDRARIFAQEQIFLIGVRVLTGTTTAILAGSAYATLAVIVVRMLLQRVADELSTTHGIIPGGEAVIVAMGKLGGREMTASSDLDLMLLYDAPDSIEASDGAKPLAVSQYYSRLVQRLVTALSAPTAEGQLYAVDFRLRPSGNKGPLATSLKAFVAYQGEEAWTWEHMALTRARVIAGPPRLANRVETAIKDALTAPREPAKLMRDVREMRGLIERDKGTDDIWDIKQVAGGLVDVEFIAQYLMLRNASSDPKILSTHTQTALANAAEAGFLLRVDADILLPAVALYGGLTQVLRLAHDGVFKPSQSSERLRALLARTADVPSFSVLEAHLRATVEAVRASFVRMIGQPTE
jgi:glutamate-ammonia-ligase adenylyltransferase